MKYVIPILVAALLAYALIRRVNPYEPALVFIPCDIENYG